MTGRAKWDAWAAAAKKYDAPQAAEDRYLEIARSLGWSESSAAAPTVKKQRSADLDIDLERLSDEDDSPPTQSQISPQGLGLAVSTMAKRESVGPTDKTIHGLAVSSDVTGLASLLKEYPHMDLNVLDEYVCLCFS